LRWQPSTDDDCRSYIIYSNDGAGDISYAAALDTITRIDIHRRWLDAGTGDGTGRISTSGAWTGEDTNEAFTIEAASGEYRHNLTGEWSDWEEITTETWILLDYGAQVLFEDAASAYESKEFEVFVGPLVEWNSDELSEGTWKFAVKAADEAGNLSAAVEKELEIIHRPDPVSGLVAVWDGEEIALSWQNPNDPDLAAILIYSNFSKTFETLGDKVLTDAPWVTVTGGG
jgi:hypothetical protein